MRNKGRAKEGGKKCNENRNGRGEEKGIGNTKMDFSHYFQWKRKSSCWQFINLGCEINGYVVLDGSY